MEIQSLIFKSICQRLPVLSGVIARRLFAKKLSNTVPHIHNLKGGFKGSLLRASLIMEFSFNPPLDRNGLLSGWESQYDRPLMKAALQPVAGTGMKITKLYFKPSNPEGGGNTWLLVDEDQSKGILYIAWV